MNYVKFDFESLPRVSYAIISYIGATYHQKEIRLNKYVEFIYLEKGNFKVKLDNGECFEVLPGEYCILPMNIKYEIIFEKDISIISNCIAFFMDTGICEIVDKENVIFEHCNNFNFVKNECFYLPFHGTLSLFDKGYHDMKKIITCYDNMKEYSNINVASLILSFFVQFANNYLTKLISNSNEEKSSLQIYCDKIDNYLENNFSKPITMSVISRYMELHENYISSFYKKIKGITVMNKLIEIRMQEAKNLLAKNRYKINEIAQMVGYEDCKYFNNVFKKYENITPGKYFNKFYEEKVYSYSKLENS